MMLGFVTGFIAALAAGAIVLGLLNLAGRARIEWVPPEPELPDFVIPDVIHVGADSYLWEALQDERRYERRH